MKSVYVGHITLFELEPEAKEFAHFLREKGYSVNFHLTDDTIINGVSSLRDGPARDTINDLWEEYARTR
jgi:hypothetical protein